MREKEKKTPIRTLHLINIVLWLDDFGVLSSKMESFMTVWPYLAGIFCRNTFCHFILTLTKAGYGAISMDFALSFCNW
jgi:hypothetical protein